jgi:hypothetical protein
MEAVAKSYWRKGYLLCIIIYIIYIFQIFCHIQYEEAVSHI